MRNRSGLVNGVVTGFVKKVLKGGLVELEYRWLPGQPSGTATVAVPFAGGQRGMYFMPEPGDEALVAFEQGDFDHPFIVGFLWDGNHQPPDSDPKHRLILTKTGHTFLLDDSEKKIVIESSGGLKITLNDGDGSIELRGGGRALAMRDGQVQIS